MMKTFALLLLAAASGMPAASAAQNDVYEFTLYTTGDVKGTCQAAGSELGESVLAAFAAAIPGYTPYDGGSRFLRAGDNRDLTTINMCARSYCDKPANYDACIWNGCNCSCGRGRELQVSGNASDDAKIAQTKEQIDAMLAAKSVQLGCQIFLGMKKVRG